MIIKAGAYRFNDVLTQPTNTEETSGYQLIRFTTSPSAYYDIS